MTIEMCIKVGKYIVEYIEGNRHPLDITIDIIVNVIPELVERCRNEGIITRDVGSTIIITSEMTRIALELIKRMEDRQNENRYSITDQQGNYF